MILLVEDNTDDVDLTLRAFEKVKVTNPVEVVRDGAQALERLRDTTKALPSVILLDLKLPKVGGLEVLKAIRADARTQMIPVVILTSSKEEADIMESTRFIVSGCWGRKTMRSDPDFVSSPTSTCTSIGLTSPERNGTSNRAEGTPSSRRSGAAASECRRRTLSRRMRRRPCSP